MPRARTGSKRPYPIEINYALEEEEFITRESHESDLTKSEFIRGMTLPSGWRERLGVLRKIQRKTAGIYRPRTGSYRPDPSTNPGVK